MKRRLDLDLATRIATEHLSYRSLIREIETDLEHISRGEKASIDGLKRLLRTFQAQVRGHFALEERGGLFEVYGESAPGFRRQARVMLAQHGDFLARLARLLEAAGTITRLDGPEFEGFSRDLRFLVADLRRHERDEDELLERLVEQDLRHGVRRPANARRGS